MQRCYEQALAKAHGTGGQAVDLLERGFELLFEHEKWLKDIPAVFVFDHMCEFKWETGAMYMMSTCEYYLLYERSQKRGCAVARKEKFFTWLSQENVSQNLVWKLQLFL